MFLRFVFWIPLTVFLSAQTWELQDVRIERFENASGQASYRLTTAHGTVEGVLDDRLHLIHGSFDPLIGPPPGIQGGLLGQSNQETQILQFVVPPQEAFRQELRRLGIAILGYLPRNAYIVKVPPDRQQALRDLNYVRFLGPYHPAYRLPPSLSSHLMNTTAQPYNLMLAPNIPQEGIAQRLRSAQMDVLVERSGKHLLRASLTGSQLRTVMNWDDILFIDPYSTPEKDMDVVREMSGINTLETIEGLDGEGLKGEVFDSGFNPSHIDFDHHPLIQHSTVDARSHGASTSGIIFGDGSGNPVARGLMPRGQGIIADSSHVLNRYAHTLELHDKAYEAVFQTSSVGSTRTTDYTTISADLDATAFDSDIVICQSQSNQGTRDSRPEAWAKNVISGGGVLHRGTADPSDDCWCNGASIGPAADGRIKPDLVAHYDRIETTTSGSATAYIKKFAGTSSSTPIICGQVGLVYEMWHKGLFGNVVTPGASPYENRCHASTVKALLINSAYRYDFDAVNTDMARVHQGWGMPNLDRLYERRNKLLIIDESQVLAVTQSASYEVTVLPGEAAFEATLVFADPPGQPLAAEARINNLNLRVQAPDGTIYHGNHGLLDGNLSLPGGSANTIDTVENVFINLPMEGTWTITVTASELNADGHAETPAVDADFALVVAGGYQSGFTFDSDRNSDQICAPGAVSIQLTLEPLLDFSDEITLEADVPEGFALILPNSAITAPSTFFATLTMDEMAQPGHYQIPITARSGDLTRQVIYSFDFDRVPALRPEGMRPSNGEAEVNTAPTLRWTRDPLAIDYDLQVSSEADFSTIDVEATVERDFYRVLAGLDPYTCYYWRVRGRSTCGAGPWALGGFMTGPIPDYFSQQFTSGFDLAYRTLTFTPSESIDHYTLCTSSAAGFPVDPSGAVASGLVDDSHIQLSLGTPVPFFGQNYSELFLSSNGYITFGSGDATSVETMEAHFNLPRVSAFFDDLNPSQGGSVVFQGTEDAVVLTWIDVPEFDQGNINNFQIALSYNGIIGITYLGMDADDGIVGLSPGGGLPFGFTQSDLSTYGSCPGKAKLGASYTPCLLDSCVWDITGDGFINDEDLAITRENWLENGPGDLNADSLVSILDMIGLVNGFGICINEWSLAFTSREDDP